MIIGTLKCDGRHKDRVVFERWLEQTTAVVNDLSSWGEGYYPFHDNELAGVSLLIAGAARAGFAPIAEYKLRKRGKKDKRTRTDGRADLWFLCKDRGYSFEFKRGWEDTNLLELRCRMASAYADIERVPIDEADHRYAGVIAPVYATSLTHYEGFAKESDIVWELRWPDESRVFIYFRRHL